MQINELLQYAISHHASDIHLSSGAYPLVRIDGDLISINDTSILNESEIKNILHDLIPKITEEKLNETKEIDCSFTLSKLARFRVNIFKQQNGLSAALRIIPHKIPTMESLKLPKVFIDLCELTKGLVLITGPTGSGKSTTLAAMINYINETQQKHILTLEDPIEFIHSSKKCLIQQRNIKEHTQNFSDALKAALREDPDYILVGELRDLETIRLALTAAETGHLVFATLHTNSAADTINRVIDVFPATEKELVRALLSTSLQAVISQALLKKIGGGRVAAFEIMRCTTAINNLIRENKIPQIHSAIQTGQSYGMISKEQYLQQLNAKGLINL